MYKQVIIIRKDLKMPRGKIATQAAHVSNLPLIGNYSINKGDFKVFNESSCNPETIQNWISDGARKITLAVNSEEELNNLFEQAKEKGYFTGRVTDRGYTCFNGKSVVTAISIGPQLSESLDLMTGHLKLLN